jgi:DNA-binding NarL/FixJ family response regulator
MKLRILIVDDMDSMRCLIRQYFNRFEEITLVGEAVNGDEALALAERYSPDVILLDICLHGESGVEVARRIKSVVPDVHIYLFSAFEVEEFGNALDISPTDGFIQKSNLKSELKDMIRKESIFFNRAG